MAIAIVLIRPLAYPFIPKHRWPAVPGIGDGALYDKIKLNEKLCRALAAGGMAVLLVMSITT